MSGEVFANWYYGEIRIPQGEQLDYVHMGYGSMFKRDLFLNVVDGVVVATPGCRDNARLISAHK